MSEFENAIPEKEQELKDRTDAIIGQVGKLSDEDLSQVSGGSVCTDMSKYGCVNLECDTDSEADCPVAYYDCRDTHWACRFAGE